MIRCALLLLLVLINQVSGQVDSDPGTGGGSDFLCVDSEEGDDFLCVYMDPDEESFPFDNPDSFLFSSCVQDLAVVGEPTPENCNSCVVAIGTLEDVENALFCDSCNFLPSNDTTDGLWNIEYNCSNLFQGACVGRDANGECIASDSSGAVPAPSPVATPVATPAAEPVEAPGQEVVVDSDPGSAGTVEGFECVENTESGEGFLCVFPFDGTPFPFDEPGSFLFASCLEDITLGIEPTSSNCMCNVAIGSLEDVENTEFCDSCSFLPSNDETDGMWTIEYDCSNVLEGPCVGRDSTGACISNEALVDSDPDTGGGEGFGCVEDEMTDSFLCAYAAETSFPFDNPESFLFMTCQEDVSLGIEPTDSNCICNVVLGTLEDIDNSQFCDVCAFLPTNNTEDGLWGIEYDCSNVLEGPCVGRDANGACIASDDSGQEPVEPPVEAPVEPPEEPPMQMPTPVPDATSSAMMSGVAFLYSVCTAVFVMVMM